MVANEPEGAMTWYPVSDHPTDKATYDIAVTVPKGKVAVANGLPAGPPATRYGWTRWAWHAPDPMASYLATASVGESVTVTLPPVDAPILAARASNPGVGWKPSGAPIRTRSPAVTPPSTYEAAMLFAPSPT